MNIIERTTNKTPTKRAFDQFKISVIKQVGNVLLKSLTAFLSRKLRS